MSRNRIISGIVVLMIYSFYFQWGGIGMKSLVAADDITIRQATCEIISAVALFGAIILTALLPIRLAKGVLFSNKENK